jgi:hypothetical protein
MSAKVTTTLPKGLFRLSEIEPEPQVQKRSKQLSTSCEAVFEAGHERLALLSFAEFYTPSLTAQGGQRPLP